MRKTNPRRRKTRTHAKSPRRYRRRATVTVRLNPAKKRRKTVAKKRRVSMATRAKLRRAALKRSRGRKQTGRKHRLTVYKRKGRWSRSRRSRLVGRHTRINPRRSYRRSYRRRRTRRNPVQVRRIFNRRLIENSVTFLAGFFGGLFVKRQVAMIPVLDRIPMQYSGIVPLALGGWMAAYMRNKRLRAVGGGMFAAGLFDLVRNFIDLPFTAALNTPVSGTNFIPGGPAEVIGAGMGSSINNYQIPAVVGAYGGGEADFVDSIENFG